MTKFERRILQLWLALLVATGLAFWAPGLIGLFIILIVTAPLGFFLQYAPTALLYLTATLLLYWPLRFAAGSSKLRRWSLAGAAASLAALAGFALASMINRDIVRQADRIVAEDRGEPPLLGKRNGIALVTGPQSADQGRCWGECQRLLFKGLTPFVIVATTAQLEASRAGRPVKVMRHRVVPVSGGCGPVRLVREFLREDEWGKRPNPPNVWDYQDILRERGLCLRSEWVNELTAEAYLIRRYGYPDHGFPDRRRFLWQPDRTVLQREVLIRSDSRWSTLFKSTDLQGQLLAAPLQIEPPFAFTTYRPGRLVPAGVLDRGTRFENSRPSDLIRDDLLLPELAARIRRLDGSQ